MSRPRALAALTLVLLLLGVAVVWGVQTWKESQRSDLQRAMATAPAGAERFSWTDWDGVRRVLGAEALSPDSPASDVEAFLDEAFDRDLSSTSASVSSALALQDSFGFSPATARWELFSQSPQGAVVALRMPDDADFADLADNLAGLGFSAPEGGDDGVWAGGADLLAGIGTGGLSPEFQFVALDADSHLVLTSDDESYLATALEAANGSGETVTGLEPVVEAAGDAVSAAVYAGVNGCTSLAMSQADQSDQALADQLVATAGEVNPYTGFAMAVQPDGEVRVSMSFESEDQARVNADSRAQLAQGPAVGQGGEFADRFALVRAEADDAVVTLVLDPRERSYVVSDLSSGPVLYATC